MDGKRCKKCGKLKPITEFYKAAGMRDGRRSDCKICNLAAKRNRYDADPRLAIERVQRWREQNPEKYRSYQAKYRKRPERKAAMRELHLKRTFGITQEDYDAMLEAQGGGCAICGRPPRPDISLHVDHDHVTGKVRGLTCFPCNNSLGLMREDPQRFAKAADYLDAHDPDVEEMAELARKRLYALVGR